MISIINDSTGISNQEVLNIGFPHQACSFSEFAGRLIEVFSAHSLSKHFKKPAQVCSVSGTTYYGAGYQDVPHRSPSIDRVQQLLGWKPQISLTETLTRTVDYWIQEALERRLR